MIDITATTRTGDGDDTATTQRRHSDDTATTQREPYSTNFLANELGVKPGTIRSRWFKWISEIAPEALLKVNGGWSELARSLFAEFSKVPASDRKLFISDAKARYSHEWGPAGVTDCELMPESAGEALALFSQGNLSLESAMNAAMDSAIQLSEAMEYNQAQIDQAELQRWATEGSMKGIARYQITTAAAARTYSELISRANRKQDNEKK